jgi:hypothetical protein
MHSSSPAFRIEHLPHKSLGVLSLHRPPRYEGVEGRQWRHLKNLERFILYRRENYHDRMHSLLVVNF